MKIFLLMIAAIMVFLLPQSAIAGPKVGETVILSEEVARANYLPRTAIVIAIDAHGTVAVRTSTGRQQTLNRNEYTTTEPPKFPSVILDKEFALANNLIRDVWPVTRIASGKNGQVIITGQVERPSGGKENVDYVVPSQSYTPVKDQNPGGYLDPVIIKGSTVKPIAMGMNGSIVYRWNGRSYVARKDEYTTTKPSKFSSIILSEEFARTNNFRDRVWPVTRVSSGKNGQAIITAQIEPPEGGKRYLDYVIPPESYTPVKDKPGKMQPRVGTEVIIPSNISAALGISAAAPVVSALGKNGSVAIETEKGEKRTVKKGDFTRTVSSGSPDCLLQDLAARPAN